MVNTNIKMSNDSLAMKPEVMPIHTSSQSLQEEPTPWRHP